MNAQALISKLLESDFDDPEAELARMNARPAPELPDLLKGIGYHWKNGVWRKIFEQEKCAILVNNDERFGAYKVQVCAIPYTWKSLSSSRFALIHLKAALLKAEKDVVGGLFSEN